MVLVHVIASFKFGQMLVFPLFGSFIITYGHRWTLIVSTYILLFGTILFAKALNIKEEYYLIFVRIILGVGSDTLGVTLMHAGDVTPKNHNNGYIDWEAAIEHMETVATLFVTSFFVYLLSHNKADYDAEHNGKVFDYVVWRA